MRNCIGVKFTSIATNHPPNDGKRTSAQQRSQHEKVVHALQHVLQTEQSCLTLVCCKSTLISPSSPSDLSHQHPRASGVRGALVPMEPSMDVSMESQAVGRVRRVGREGETFVHRMLMKDTIEECVLRFGDAFCEASWCGGKRSVRLEDVMWVPRGKDEAAARITVRSCTVQLF